MTRKDTTSERFYMTLNGPRPGKLKKMLSDGWTIDSRTPFLWRGTNYGTTYYLSRPNPNYSPAKENA